MSAATAAQLIELSGPDAVAFAQAQFCNDVALLSPGTSQLSAWLNPQGRVRRLFHLLQAEPQRLLLLLRGGTAAPVLPTLRMFVLRLKVQLRELEDWYWCELDTEPVESAAEGWTLALPQGRRLRLQAGSAPEGLDLAATWQRDIEAGLPWLPDPALEQLLPSWMDFARLGAISHGKGCYPGQEIVARLHFRGGGDKRVPVCLQADAAQPQGELRDADGAEAGLLLQTVAGTAAGGSALGVVRRELAVPGTRLQAGDSWLEVVPAPWALRATEQ